MSDFNKQSVKQFWDTRAAKLEETDNKASLTNLETDEELYALKLELESKVLNRIIEETNENDILLDLGCGYGHWSIHFSRLFKNVIGVEYSESLTKYGQKLAIEKNIKNIAFKHSDVCSFQFEGFYDVVLISGLFLYLHNEDVTDILTRLSKHLSKGSRVILRDGMSLLEHDHIIVDKYSSALEDNYSAIYRTPENYKRLFSECGYQLIESMDMFSKESALNKWQETRLRVMVYEVK